MDLGSPEEIVNYRKLSQIQRMASVYFPAADKPKRVDVAAVVLERDRKLSRINHYEAVY